MIYAIQHLSANYGRELAEDLNDVVSKWQDQGLEVEIQYQTHFMQTKSVFSALLIVRRPNEVS